MSSKHESPQNGGAPPDDVQIDARDAEVPEEIFLGTVNYSVKKKLRLVAIPYFLSAAAGWFRQPRRRSSSLLPVATASARRRSTVYA